MKHILSKTAAVSFFITFAGFLINLVSYLARGSLVFFRTIYGGEWMGYSGFGLLLNRTFPLTAAGDPAAAGSTWLSFDPAGLFASFAGIFAVTAAILMIRSGLMKKPGYK